jgi:TolA-binding protein
MSLHELHPEELIDKAERGALDASERKQLDRHLAACSLCRFEVSARDDFRAQDQMNEALFSDDAIDMIVGASLRGADAHKAKIQADLRAISTRPRAMGSGRRWAMLLAVAVLLVSAQATARWLGIRTPSWLSPPTMTTVTTTSTKNGAPADEGSDVVAASKTKSSAPASVAAPAIAAVDTAAPVVATSEVTAPTAKRATVSASISNAPTTTLSAVARPASSTLTTTRPDPSASALFASANSDREQGKHVVATREYRELLEDFPNAPEADLSRATLGRLLLDDGDAMAALPLFDAYLQKNETGAAAALREETMVNRATALERLHRSGEEADAWQALLSAYPQSLHAERARDRLKEIGAR